MVGIPLANLSSKIPGRKLVLNLGDEIFFNAGKEIAHNHFDQNRVLNSPTVQWNRSLSVSFTYNYQYASTPDADIYLVSHLGWVQIRHNLDFGNPHSRD